MTPPHPSPALRHGGAGGRASEVERRELGERFAELCRIYSPSGAERACAELVRAELEGLGLVVAEDGAARALGGDCGNLFARVPGTDARRSILFCAHLDTVPAAQPIEPVLRDGGWENRNPAILGADNKAAVAVLLGLAHRLAREPATAGVELLFTVGEEVGLVGAKEFEPGVLRSRFGFAFDASLPLGGIVVASPSYYRIEAELHGVAAHAGAPQHGRSAILAAARAIAAMSLGRLEEGTSANIGTIEGGSAPNVVPDRCRVVGEARSLDPIRAEQVASALIECLTDAANDPECECDLDITLEREFDGYRLAPSSPEYAFAARALGDCGYETIAGVSGGGSDVNALRARGAAVVNLGNGAERPHEPTERISVASLEGMLDIALALVARAGEEQ